MVAAVDVLPTTDSMLLKKSGIIETLRAVNIDDDADVHPMVDSKIPKIQRKKFQKKKGFQKSEKRKKFENVRKKAWAIGVFLAAAEELRKSYGKKAKGCGR